MPTALDNGQRSPRKLLGAVGRLLGGRSGDENERVAVVATLLPGSRERAAEIISKGAPYGLRLAGFRRHSVFLAEEAVVFVFEGQGIEGPVRNLVNDPERLCRVRRLGTASSRDARACEGGVLLASALVETTLRSGASGSRGASVVWPDTRSLRLALPLIGRSRYPRQFLDERAPFVERSSYP